MKVFLFKRSHDSLSNSLAEAMVCLYLEAQCVTSREICMAQDQIEGTFVVEKANKLTIQIKGCIRLQPYCTFAYLHEPTYEFVILL